MMSDAAANPASPELHPKAGWISAFPNPLPVFDYSGTGLTTLTWMSIGTEEVEVRVGSPDGPLLSRTGPSGHADTGKWVVDGMVFYLQDVSEGRPLTQDGTLATVTVRVNSCRITTGLSGQFESQNRLRSGAVSSSKRVLVAGWFSFEHGGVTAGDLLSQDLVCEWLELAGYSYDVALAGQFPGGVDWRTADPTAYSHIVFVCGPFNSNDATRRFLEHFMGRPLIGLNLSMIRPLDEWNPFDVLLERDSSATSRADISFLSRRPLVPVAGLVLVEPVPEHKERAMHEQASHLLLGLIRSREMAVVEIDTRLESNITGLRTPAEIESLIARMDVVLTTRLHGMVLALKNGVPALAIDPHAGGSKVRRQADTIGWPVVFTPDAVSRHVLSEALDYCLTDDARRQARKCAERAWRAAEDVRRQFIAALPERHG